VSIIPNSHQHKQYSPVCISNSRQKVDKEGNATIEIELFDKVQVLRILAKASGLLDTPDDGQKPSVIGVTIQAPEDVEPRHE